jgi:hypothetical protein
LQKSGKDEPERIFQTQIFSVPVTLVRREAPDHEDQERRQEVGDQNGDPHLQSKSIMFKGAIQIIRDTILSLFQCRFDMSYRALK